MDAYEKFREKIDTLPYGSPRTQSKVELAIFEKLMNPVEAEIACKLSGELEDIETISRRTGLEIDMLGPILEELAKNKVIFKLVTAPKPAYCLVPYMPGIFEFQERDIEKCEPELVSLFEKYYTERLGDAVLRNKNPFMRVIPVRDSVQTEMNILVYEEVDKMIDESPVICLAKCLCRVHAQVLGKGCGYPQEDMCIILSPWAEYFIEYNIGRKASKEEAKKSLKTAEDAGLVHSTLNVQNGAFGICNCCGCCCAILRGINQLEIPNALAKSNFVIKTQEQNCIGCGECVERCQVRALEFKDSIVILDEERCIGCGVCVSSCPSEGIVMSRRKEKIIPPETVNELMQRVVLDSQR